MKFIAYDFFQKNAARYKPDGTTALACGLRTRGRTAKTSNHLNSLMAAMTALPGLRWGTLACGRFTEHIGAQLVASDDTIGYVLNRSAMF
jgi:hypothetical protein